MHIFCLARHMLGQVVVVWWEVQVIFNLDLMPIQLSLHAILLADAVEDVGNLGVVELLHALGAFISFQVNAAQLLCANSICWGA